MDINVSSDTGTTGVESDKTDPSSNSAALVRRRGIEIRRFKCIGNSLPVYKRSKHADGRSSFSSNEFKQLEAGADVFVHPFHASKNVDRVESSSFLGLKGHYQTSGEHDKHILVRLKSLERVETADCYNYEGSSVATAIEQRDSGSHNQDCVGGEAVVTASSSCSADVAYTLDICEREGGGFNKIRVESAVLDVKTELSGILACPPSTSGCFVDGNCPPYGMLSVCGRRREMEDAVALVPSFLSARCAVAGACDYCTSQGSKGIFALHFFGVYDGHGGSQAAEFCKDRLHQALAEEVRLLADCSNLSSGSFSKDGNGCWKKALESCFLKMDAELGGSCCCGGKQCRSEGKENGCAEPIAPESVGSTAVVAILTPRQIIVGNCGDSRAVLSRGGQAIALSVDHKPDREDEMARVEAAGGRVIFWNGYRVLGVLAMSRALGDRHLKPYIIAVPEVTCTTRTSEDECLILASDGLWDVLSNEAACNIARKCFACRKFNKAIDSKSVGGEEMPDSPAATAAALLTKVAMSKGSGDNISVVVLDLRDRRKKKNRSLSTSTFD